MLTKITIILCYNSRRIVAGLIAIYFVMLLVLKNRYHEIIQRFDIPVFFLLLGFYLGLNLMTWIIKYLNKKEIKEHLIFQKLISKEGTKHK
jgi:hypothetical protein